MSDEEHGAPVVANRTTGAVTADLDAAPLGKPSRRTVSLVWLLIVGANVLVMVVAAVALCAGLFVADAPTLVEPGIALALFTTPAAFLAGLIARDPGQHS